MTTKPHVLYLINSFSSGGAERGILSLLDTGFFDGVHLELIAMHKGTGPLFDELKNKDFDGSVHCITEKEKLSIGAMFKTLSYAIKRLASKEPTHMMLSLLQANLVGLVAATLFPALKVITFAHNSRFSKSVYSLLMRILSWRINICVYDDHSSAKAMKKLFLNKKRQWHYTPLHAVSSHKHHESYTLRDPVQIFSVGRLNAQKNYTEALKAIQLLKLEGYNVMFNIIGMGDGEEMLKKLTQDLRIEDCVTFKGFVQNWTDKTEGYDIFLLSSTHEGMSIVTVEAMSCALPIVATNVGGVQEYGAHRTNMLVANNPVAEDIAGELKNMINSEELRKELGKQAATDAMELFGEDHVKELAQKARTATFSI